MNTKATRGELERAKEDLEESTKLADFLDVLIDALEGTRFDAWKQKNDQRDYLFLYTPREVEYTFVYIPQGNGSYCDLRKEGEREGNDMEIRLMCRAADVYNLKALVGVKDNKDAKRHNGDKVIVSFPGDGTVFARWEKEND